ncbi:MAG: protein kinase [Planctomycetales bacterium]|nr:protein kinase [Planctomycetales bacterium]
MGTEGDENRDGKADIERRNISDLPNRTSRDLVKLWREGSQDAARILLARYEVRLIALVAARLNRKFRESIAPEDVVQSAMGSFFRATGACAKPSIQFDSSASAWNILATFTRRKLSRAIERETAFKRGGGWSKTPLNQLDLSLQSSPSAKEADEILADIQSLLGPDQSLLLDLLLENASQKEIAKRLKVDVRTVRRRIAAMRATVAGKVAGGNESNEPTAESTAETIHLPNIHYRQFVLGKLVGSGALGKVYRARLQSDGQVVAIKFMHRLLWGNPQCKLSFLSEIDHASRIHHPGVVQYLGWGESPHGGPYLVCEYINGHSLAHTKPNNSSTSVRWLLQICEAVAAAHQVGVVHGDLTPNNILLEQPERIVVIDFGFAAYTRSPNSRNAFSESSLSQTPGGTLGFAAPEQISPAFGSISPATDIYAIGGLAYYLLTSRSPHDGNPLLDTVTDADVRLPDSPRTPAESRLAKVAKLALRKSVNDRPRSVRELARLLST